MGKLTGSRDELKANGAIRRGGRTATRSYPTQTTNILLQYGAIILKLE